MAMTNKPVASEMQRCRAVREAIDRRFRTLDALWHFMDEQEKREKQRGKRRQPRRAVA